MEMILQVLLLVLGFLMLVKGADWFVDGASGIAERFGIPQLVVGLTIVAMGTSMPEAAVSINSALKGERGNYDRKHCGEQYFEYSDHSWYYCGDHNGGGTEIYDMDRDSLYDDNYSSVTGTGKKRKSDYTQRRCYPLGGILTLSGISVLLCKKEQRRSGRGGSKTDVEIAPCNGTGTTAGGLGK